MKNNEQAVFNILVMDDQPADLPVTDSSLRVSGLYSNPGPGARVRYAGVGERPEPGTPNGPPGWYFPAFLATALGRAGIDVHDPAADAPDDLTRRLAGLSIFCSARARAEIMRADAIVFSNLPAYWLLDGLVDPARQVVVYDAQDAEDLLRACRRDAGARRPGGLAREIMRTGERVCRECDLILARSWEQKKLLNKLYKVPYARMRLAGNGVFVGQNPPPSRSEKREAKAGLQLTGEKVAVFFGTLNERNVEAAQYILAELAPACPDIRFIICGEVCKGLAAAEVAAGPENARIAGPLSEAQKMSYLRAADFALNPVEGVTAANIKMFDYFAAGLPTLATPAGGDNIVTGKRAAYMESRRSEFACSLRQLVADAWRQQTLAVNARKLVEEKFAWERLSPGLGTCLTKAAATKKNRPFFSVVIPTYERHAHLDALLRCLEKQVFKNFEVIIVDQSRERWSGDPDAYELNIFYLHTDIRGAVKARNTGAAHAAGQVIAFTDDDCRPKRHWLRNARQYFKRAEVVGVEGFIVSDKRFAEGYRAVTNEGFEGIGFMTANFLIRSEIFHRLNGFDELFDEPHFREDTDLGWRAREYGRIPFGHDVMVYHPPHKCSTARESKGERDKFFVNDPLLLKKHPQRYKDLFFMEGHYQDADFRRFFVYGALEHDVEIPDWCLESFKAAGDKACLDLLSLPKAEV